MNDRQSREASGQRAQDNQRTALIHGPQRALVNVVLVLVPLIATWAVVQAYPSIALGVGISTRDWTLAVIVGGSAIVLASVCFHWVGPAPLYAWLDRLETFAVAGSYSFLLARSPSPNSFLWAFYLFHVANLASAGPSRLHRGLIIAVPLGLGVKLAVAGSWVGVGLSVLVGSFGYLLFTLVSGVVRNLGGALTREAELKLRLAELRVTQERTRIAEDLHDGVGADLAALVWNARSLAAAAPGTAVETGARAIEERALSATEQLRDAVVGLRGRAQTWDDVANVLRQRCRELCGDLSLTLDIRCLEALPPSLDEYGELQRVTLELVRNAARHAGARRIEVEAIGQRRELRVKVGDDGRGSLDEAVLAGSGGLGTLNRRLKQIGGGMTLRSDSRGTLLEAFIPLPAA